MSSNTECEEGEGEVVLRRNSNRASDHLSVQRALEEEKEGHKRVKWSESTDIREKMKEYRRSQLCLSLDYHHIAVEEEREKAGVKEWRASLQIHPEGVDGEEEAERAEGDEEKEEEGKEDKDEIETSSDSDANSDQFDPAVDEDLDRKLHIIKAETTKHTLLPAYREAVTVYKDWLQTHSASEIAGYYQAQCDLYVKVVALYKEWSDTDSNDQVVDSRFDQITQSLQQAKAMGDPPTCVAEAITKVLTSPENVKKQKEVYEQMVSDMMAAFEEKVTVQG